MAVQVEVDLSTGKGNIPGVEQPLCRSIREISYPGSQRPFKGQVHNPFLIG